MLEDRGAEVQVRLYLSDPPTREEIDHLLHKLGLPASALIRDGEPLYRELHLDECDRDADLLDAMAENPILIERPIAIRARRAVIGRPPEEVLTLLD